MKKLPDGSNDRLVHALRLLADEKQFAVECDRAVFDAFVECSKAARGEVEPWLYDAMAPLRFMRMLRFVPVGRAIFPASLALLEDEVVTDLELAGEDLYHRPGALDLIANKSSEHESHLRHWVGAAVQMCYGAEWLRRRASRCDPEALCIDSSEMDRVVVSMTHGLDGTLAALSKMTGRKRYIQPVWLPGLHGDDQLAAYKDILQNLELKHYCALIVTLP